MAKLINSYKSGRRDGVELLVETLAGIRADERSGKAYELQLRQLSADMKGQELDHLRGMIGLEQQRQQFAIEYAQRERELKYNIDFLAFKGQELDDAAKDRLVRMTGVASQMLSDSRVIFESENKRLTDLLETNKEIARNLDAEESLAFNYVGGQAIGEDGNIDPNSPFALKDVNMIRLYNEMKDKAQDKNAFMSQKDFASTFMNFYKTGLEDSRGQGDASAREYATEYAMEGLVATAVTQLGKNVHSDLSAAANQWLHGQRSVEDRTAAASVLGKAITNKGGSISFSANLKNEDGIPGGIKRLSLSVQTGGGIFEYGRQYRLTRTSQEANTKNIAESKKTVSNINRRIDAATTFLDHSYSQFFGEDFTKDHPSYSDKGEEGKPGGTGGVLGDTEKTGNTSASGSSTTTKTAVDSKTATTEKGKVPEKDTPLSDSLLAINPGEFFDKNTQSILMNVDWMPQKDKDGSYYVALDDYYQGGQKVTGRKIPVNENTFSTRFPSGPNLGSMGGGTNVRFHKDKWKRFQDEANENSYSVTPDNSILNLPEGNMVSVYDPKYNTGQPQTEPKQYPYPMVNAPDPTGEYEVAGSGAPSQPIEYPENTARQLQLIDSHENVTSGLFETIRFGEHNEGSDALGTANYREVVDSGFGVNGYKMREDNPNQIKYGNRTFNPNTTTIGDISRLQETGELYAVGVPQVIPGTFKNSIKRLGLDPNDVFNEKNQRRVTTDLLMNATPAAWSYITGKSQDIDKAAKQLASIWRSFTDPDTGKSMSDAAGDTAKVTVKKAHEALIDARKRYLLGVDSASN